MSGSREFNRLVAAALLAAGVGAASADEIRKWTDVDGNLHYSVTGSDKSRPGGESATVLRGRTPSPDETFSVQASLRRREIEKRLATRTAELERIRAEADRTRNKQFTAWVPTTTKNPAAATASLEAQRDAMLASAQFEQEKAETLRRLRRQERQTLKDLEAAWKDFTALGAEVRARYGTTPIWFRERLDCGACPSAAAVDEALHPKKTGTGAPEASATPTAGDDDWGDEEDEDWQ